MKTSFSLFTAMAALALGAAAIPAQSSRERDLERTAERIGRVVEKSVDRAMRVVEETLRQIDLDGRPGQQGGGRIDTTFAFPQDGVVDLTTISGDIVVTGWNRGQASVRASTERGRLRWRISSSRITIETESVRGRTGQTRYELSVPEGVRVILRSTSGDLTTRGVKGPVDAHTTSGDIEVTDAGARVDLETLSGDVRASRLRGEVEASTISGSVEITDAGGPSVHVESTSGDLILANVRSRDVSTSTVSGEVEYRGTIESGGTYEFQSHSGTITLVIPSNASARFSVETFNGELDSDFPVTLQPNPSNRRGRRLEFSLGSGDARVLAETFSGSIEIRRDTRR
jgi:DUF4097 and DUF4098 domain-containing protein YvlB